MTQPAPLILDIEGTRLTATDRRRLAHPLTGGLILFGRNWADRAQLAALCAEIKAVRADLLICVDHEGGRVQRFRTDGFTHLPPMRALGELWMAKPLAATNAATAAGYVLGAELRACGVDFSFTPVLDLDYQDEAPTVASTLPAPRGGAERLGRPGASRSSVIGDRAFARDPRVVALLAKSLMHGLLQAGMANCGKHFPGHGFVRADSHTDIPVDRRSLKAILADDAAPYGWLITALSSVMPGHVIYPKVDSRAACFSSRWLNDILRRRLGFGGAIFSDDLSMTGARWIDGREVSYAEAAVEALSAGCDMVLLCNQSVDGGEAVDALLDGLAEAQLKGRWTPREASEERRRALLPRTPAPAWDELMTEAHYMQALRLLP
ncbi:MAG: beta-N-acetylhexosaminidase [Burkholderiales bacterium]|nr:beta-N-acetylhexosaminidase [Burkholderiales bacterium]